MSGHSKWSTIKHQKGAADAKRGRVFSRYSKAIAIAVREAGPGGDDPETNPKLRMLIDKAKAENMPKQNIERAIDRGAGRIEGATYEELIFEGFGPHQVSMIIECVSDNRNRTAAEIKSVFDKNGGTIGAQGSTSYNFTKRGVIAVDASQLADGVSKEEYQLELMDFGPEDIKVTNKAIILYTGPSQVHSIAQQLTSAGHAVLQVDQVMQVATPVSLSQKAFTQFERFLEIIDEHDDVQTITHNAVVT